MVKSHGMRSNNSFKLRRALKTTEYPHREVSKWVVLGDGRKIRFPVKVYEVPPKGLENRANSMAFSSFAQNGTTWIRHGASA